MLFLLTLLLQILLIYNDKKMGQRGNEFKGTTAFNTFFELQNRTIEKKRVIWSNKDSDVLLFNCSKLKDSVKAVPDLFINTITLCISYYNYINLNLLSLWAFLLNSTNCRNNSKLIFCVSLYLSLNSLLIFKVLCACVNVCVVNNNFIFLLSCLIYFDLQYKYKCIDI